MYKNSKRNPQNVDILTKICYCNVTVTKKYFNNFNFVFALRVCLLHYLCDEW